MRKSLVDLENEISSQNVILLERCEDPNYVKVRCVDCGHESEKLITSLKKSSLSKCDSCTDISISRKADELDIHYLGRSNKIQKNACDYRRFRLSCGHTREIVLSSLYQMLEHPRCQDCLTDEIVNLVESHGFAYQGRLPNKAIVACQKCSHVFTPQISNLRHGMSVICPACKSCSKDSRSYVYAFKLEIDNFNWIKIGHSVNPYLRHLAYGLDSSVVCKLLGQVRFETIEQSRKAESQLLTRFKSFKLDSSDMKQYMLNGFSECFDITIEDQLMKELTQMKVSDTIREAIQAAKEEL